jgi:hypothetical protein
MTRMRRWLPFMGAVLATVIVAGGFGLAVGALAAPRTQPAPQLKTVSTAALSRLGIRLSAPQQPVYCSLAGVAVGQGWLASGTAGCAISQHAGEAAARQGASVTVLESALALVSSSRVSTLGNDHLAWVVVTQQTINSCQRAYGGWTVCLGGRGGFTWNQLVLVDAHTGGVINRQRLTPVGVPRAAQLLPSPAGFLGG